jgi:hypothetical protein
MFTRQEGKSIVTTATAVHGLQQRQDKGRGYSSTCIRTSKRHQSPCLQQADGYEAGAAKKAFLILGEDGMHSAAANWSWEGSLKDEQPCTHAIMYWLARCT